MLLVTIVIVVEETSFTHLVVSLNRGDPSSQDLLTPLILAKTPQYMFIIPTKLESFSSNFFNSLQVSTQIFSVSLVLLPVDRKHVDKVDQDYCIKKLSDFRKLIIFA